MRRLLLFLIMLCLFAISARLELLNIHQQHRVKMEGVHLLRSAAITLEIPLMEELLD